MEQTVRDKILEIKKSLRLSMNGVVSSLQRKQGLDYKINFGVEIPRLKSIAAQYPKERTLALALWQENIRECKMLAIMLMPSEAFTATDANRWIAETPFTEVADHLSMQLQPLGGNGDYLVNPTRSYCHKQLHRKGLLWKCEVH